MANRGVAELRAEGNARRAADDAAAAALAAGPPLVLAPAAAAAAPAAAAAAPAAAAPAAAPVPAPHRGGIHRLNELMGQIDRFELTDDLIERDLRHGLITKQVYTARKDQVTREINRLNMLIRSEFPEIARLQRGGSKPDGSSDSESDSESEGIKAGSGKESRAHASDSYGDQWVQGMNRRVKASMLNTQA